MKKLNQVRANSKLLRKIKKRHGYQAAMELMVGGYFEGAGQVEIALLRHCGLKPADYLIDAGCGSGRLAIPLSKVHKGRYLGIDIMKQLVKHAVKNVDRDDWRFEVTDGLSIPESDGVADMVCFFSVFTHILHENTFVYLREARRVLKKGGRIVFSFLEFREEGHWRFFDDAVVNVANDAPLNVFLSRDAIEAFAGKLDLAIVEMHAGSEAFIPMDSGSPVPFAQSVAVLAT